MSVNKEIREALQVLLQAVKVSSGAKKMALEAIKEENLRRKLLKINLACRMNKAGI